MLLLGLFLKLVGVPTTNEPGKTPIKEQYYIRFIDGVPTMSTKFLDFQGKKKLKFDENLRFI